MIQSSVSNAIAYFDKFHYSITHAKNSLLPLGEKISKLEEIKSQISDETKVLINCFPLFESIINNESQNVLNKVDLCISCVRQVTALSHLVSIEGVDRNNQKMNELIISIDFYNMKIHNGKKILI